MQTTFTFGGRNKVVLTANGMNRVFIIPDAPHKKYTLEIHIGDKIVFCYSNKSDSNLIQSFEYQGNVIKNHRITIEHNGDNVVCYD